MSGSVCNQGTGFECKDCLPELVCNDGMTELLSTSCCNNFQRVIDFTKDIVNSMSDIDVDQKYSIVGFSNNANVAVGMTDSEEAIAVLDDLVYSGGKTNHAAAIYSCRGAMGSNYDEGLILLITDGDPSEPEDSPQTTAELAAEEAKAAGINIVPVMIIPQFVTLIPQPLKYLQGISSDGEVLSVSDFDALDSIQNSLLGQLSCQV